MKIKCARHPRYYGMATRYPPYQACYACWTIYRLRRGLERGTLFYGRW